MSIEKPKNSSHLVLTEEELQILIKDRKIKFDVGPVDYLDISGGLYIQVNTPVESDDINE